MATRVEGLDRLKKRFARIPPEVRSAMRQAIAQGADEIVDMQKRLVPVKSGKLRDSIVQTWGGQQLPSHASLRGGTGNERAAGDLSVTISAGNSAVRYAHLVEFGTAPHIVGGKFAGARHPGTTAQAFFFPAYRSLRRRVKSRISRAMKKAIKGTAQK